MGKLETAILNAGFNAAEKAVVAADMQSATPKKLFTVTGVVEVQLIPVVTTTVTRTAGALTAEIGIAGNTAALVAQADKSLLIAGAVFNGAAPANPAAAPAAKILANGEDIYLTTGTGNAETGAMTVYCRWRAISATGAVVAA